MKKFKKIFFKYEEENIKKKSDVSLKKKAQGEECWKDENLSREDK